jgi:hypothetical protein
MLCSLLLALALMAQEAPAKMGTIAGELAPVSRHADLRDHVGHAPVNRDHDALRVSDRSSNFSGHDSAAARMSRPRNSDRR